MYYRGHTVGTLRRLLPALLTTLTSVLVQRELKVQLMYKRRLDQIFQDNSLKEVWNRMKTNAECSSNLGDTIEGDVEIENQMNNFFNRFDTSVHYTPHQHFCFLSTCLNQMEAHVCGELRRLCPNKAR